MNHRQPRSHLGKSHARPDRAGFGARHNVIYDDHLKAFYEAIDDEWIDRAGDVRSRFSSRLGQAEDHQVTRAHTLSNEVAGLDAESLGIVILERHLTGKKARGPVQWNRNDIGRIQLEIDRRIASLRIPYNDKGLVEVTISDVVRLPRSSSEGLPRALGLIANQAKPEAGYLADAHTIALEGLGHRLKDHKDSSESFIPYLPLGAINEDVGPRSFEACIGAVRQILPITVEIMPISFFSEQEIF